VKTVADQLPPAGSVEAAVLEEVYRFFDGRKYAFELLAARVTAQLLSGSGAVYREGWLTGAGGGGGMDFVGRLDVGALGSNTPLVVLGQAKCVARPPPLARIRWHGWWPGWIGVFVTTGVFSHQAQVEVIDDEYPLVLVSGRVLTEQVLRMAAADYDGDVDALLRAFAADYDAAVTHRRPEEILHG
jgi:hypothetical protein